MIIQMFFEMRRIPPLTIKSVKHYSDWKKRAEEIVKHGKELKEATYSEFRVANVDWSYVERLMPKKFVPEIPAANQTFPSGWKPPRDTPPDVPYYIRRGPDHMPALFLERRRDELNPKTMDFEYVELVTVRNIEGDIFACNEELKRFLEAEIGHPVATHVDELKGYIKVKGADRTLLERFVYESGF